MGGLQGYNATATTARASHMRVSMAVVLGIFCFLSGLILNAQNCPTLPHNCFQRE